MLKRKVSLGSALALELVVVGAFVAAYAAASPGTKGSVRALVTGARPAVFAPIRREMPLRISPLYDDPEVASDEELAAVLQKVRPKFSQTKLKPNFAEHALRTWGIHATFADPEVLSGAKLCDVLIDHGKYLASWKGSVQPLLEERDQGVAIRWGRERQQGPGASVHHDHWLACLTEAGIPLDEPIFTPSRRHHTIRDVLSQALCDFQLDERETEWSAMAIGLWLPPARSWINGEGRRISFDLMAERLLRGDNRLGVCSGTHRLYSLVVLIRLDDQFHILSGSIREKVLHHLASVRDLITLSQFPDGHWSSDWSRGEDAVKTPSDDELHAKVIATGHHLEWLALAPQGLLPPREVIRKAADWVIQTTVNQPDAAILDKYTFYSHVGNALALWRGTSPAVFWRNWTKTHPLQAASSPTAEARVDP